MTPTLVLSMLRFPAGDSATRSYGEKNCPSVQVDEPSSRKGWGGGFLEEVTATAQRHQPDYWSYHKGEGSRVGFK